MLTCTAPTIDQIIEALPTVLDSDGIAHALTVRDAVGGANLGEVEGVMMQHPERMAAAGFVFHADAHYVQRTGPSDMCDRPTGAYPVAVSCEAPLPPTCQGTDWPPLTSMQRYAAERAAGTRVPPSVSQWRHADMVRQAAAEQRIRAGREPVAVAWGPGPACDDRKAVAP